MQPNKMISYLVDLQTIRVLDLLSGATAASISHDARVDWLVLWTCLAHSLHFQHDANAAQGSSTCLAFQATA